MKEPSLACFIDGQSGADNFVSDSKFQVVNSHNVNERVTDSLLSDISHSLESYDLESISLFKDCNIDAFFHLKQSKFVGSLLMSCSFDACSSCCELYIAIPFTAIFRHGYIYLLN